MEKSPQLPSVSEMDMLLAGLDLLGRKKFDPQDFIFEVIKREGEQREPDADKIRDLVKDKVGEELAAHKTYLEDVKLLQAKMIHLKRFLSENSPVKDVYELLRQQNASSPNE